MAVLFQFGGAFPQILSDMQSMGFFLYLFPFLLALAIFYGVLTFALEKQLPKPARGLVSVIFAFFVMLYSSWNVMIVSFFANLGGMGLIVGSGILFIAILLGLMGFDIKNLTSGEGKSKWIFILFIILIGVLIFLGAGAGWLIDIPSWSTTSQFWTALFFIIILAIVVWWLGSGENSGGAAPAAKPG